MRLIAALLGLLLVAPATAQRPAEDGFTQQDWCGLNTFNDSSRIGDCDAQDVENFLTDHGYLEKFPGISMATRTFSGTVGALGSYTNASGNEFIIIRSSQNIIRTDLGSSMVTIATVSPTAQVSIQTAFGKLYIADGANPLIETNGTSSTTIAAAPICKILGFSSERLWCGNIPATSNSAVAVSSYGGVGSWTVPSDVSQRTDVPDLFYFQRDDGEVVNCVKVTPFGVVVGKKSSLHVVKGIDNRTFRKVLISGTVGCSDQSSMQMHEGVLTWLNQDGVYQWPGAGPPKWASRDIDSVVKALRQGTSNSDTLAIDTQSEFEEGVLTASGTLAAMSTTINTGAVTPSTWGVVHTSSSDFANDTLVSMTTGTLGAITLSSYTWRDEFGDNDFSVGQVTWTASADWSNASGRALTTANSTNIMHTTTVNISSGHWQFSFFGDQTVSPITDRCNLAQAYCLDFQFITKPGEQDYYTLRLIDGGAQLLQYKLIKSVSGSETTLAGGPTLSYGDEVSKTFAIDKSTDGRIYVFADDVFIASTTDTSVTGTAYVRVRGIQQTVGGSIYTQNIDNFYAFQQVSSGTATSPIFDIGLSTPVPGIFSSTFTLGTNEGWVNFWVRGSTSPNNDMWTAFQATSDTLRVSGLDGGYRYQQYLVQAGTYVSTKTPTITDIGLTADTTGYYYCPVKYIGTDVTSWDQFVATESSATATSYWTRASNTTFSALDTSPAWTAQINGATVATSTGSYVQCLVRFNQTTGSPAPYVSRIAYNWLEGSTTASASASYKQRYFLCAAGSASSTTNDVCLVLQRNGKWTKLTGPKIAAMTVFDGTLYGGSAADTRVWRMMQDGVYNYDGDAIAAYWVSKDFMFAPNGRDWATGEKTLNEVWVDAVSSTQTYMSVGYSVNKSTTYATKTIDLGAYGDVVNTRAIFSDTYGKGKYFRIKLADSTNDRNAKVNAFSIYGEPLMRRE